MRIPLKLTVGLGATALLTFGAYAVRHIAEEEQDLRTAIERETRLLVRSLQVALENALRDGQEQDVREMVERLELVDRALDVFVFDTGAELRVSSADGAPLPAGEALREKALASGRMVLRYEPPDDPRVLLAAVPLIGDDRSPLGAMLVSRPLDDLRADLDDTRRASVLVVLFVVLATAVVVFALGTLYISRPVARLREGMRRVRAGDLGTALPHGSRDEVGALAGEFNVMLGQLREARTRLEEEMEARRVLQRALQQSDKLATVGQLSAGLAHEIGSPLQILSGRARALASRDHEPAEVRRQAEILVAQCDRITRIVEQVLRFTRRRAAALAEVDLEKACRAVVDLLDIEARRLGVTLELTATPGLPPVKANEDQVQQIVLNLATNALAATGPGGRVTVSLEPARRGEQSVVRLAVVDTGVGIPEDVQPRLFEPFFTTRGGEGGSGFGLAVVKTLVTEHHGSVRVESAAGHGSRFEVELPAVRTAPDEERA